METSALSTTMGNLSVVATREKRGVRILKTTTRTVTKTTKTAVRTKMRMKMRTKKVTRKKMRTKKVTRKRTKKITRMRTKRRAMVVLINLREEVGMTRTDVGLHAAAARSGTMERAPAVKHGLLKNIGL